jgi:hypothetical protein
MVTLQMSKLLIRQQMSSACVVLQAHGDTSLPKGLA